MDNVRVWKDDQEQGPLCVRVANIPDAREMMDLDVEKELAAPSKKKKKASRKKAGQ